MSEIKSVSQPVGQIRLSPKEKRCLFAFVAMLLLFLPYALLEPISSDTNDDTAMNLIAAGAFGENSQYLVYINVIFGYLLKALFAIFPSINWYLITQLSLNALSAALIGAALAYFLDYKHLILPLLLLHFYIAGEFYQSVQFTRNAYLYALCAIIMLTMTCTILSHRIKVSVIGGIMMFMAFLIRMECVLPLLPFLFLILFREFIKDKRRCALSFITLSICAIACITALIANKRLFSDREEWIEYNNYHFSGTFPILDDDFSQGFSFERDDLSFAVNDLVLLKEYQYADFDYFSVDYLKQLQSAKSDSGLSDLFRSLPGVFSQNFDFPGIPDYVNISPGLHSILYLAERIFRWNICLDIILVIFLIRAVAKKKISSKECIFIALLFACFMADLMILILFTGHAPRRATIGPRMAFEFLSFFILLNTFKADASTQGSSLKPVMLTIPCIALLFICSLRLMNYTATPADTETSIVLNELRNYSDDHYLLDGMLLWGERLGITDLRTLNRTSYHNFFDNFILSGGWLAETPHATQLIKADNITAPMAGLSSDAHMHYVVPSWHAERVVPLMMDYLNRRGNTDISPRAAYAGNELLIVDFYPAAAQQP